MSFEGVSAKYFMFQGEYKVFRQDNCGLSLKAGLSKYLFEEEEEEDETGLGTMVGVKGTYTVAKGLDAMAEIGYNFNGLTKTENEDEYRIYYIAAGVEYSLPQLPPLKLCAYAGYSKHNYGDYEKFDEYGVNLYAKYALSF